MVRLNSTGREFRARLEEAIAPLSEFNSSSSFFVYVISDPRPKTGTTADETNPIYVGQTSNMLRRARQHLALGGSAEANLPLHKRLYEILRQNMFPHFAVVETASTRLAALEAERRWALNLKAEGNNLFNDWDEHHAAKQIIYGDGTGVPTKRLWSMTIADAQGSGIRLSIECSSCQTSIALPIEQVSQRCHPKISLLAVKSAIRCPNCGSNDCLTIIR